MEQIGVGSTWKCRKILDDAMIKNQQTETTGQHSTPLQSMSKLSQVYCSFILKLCWERGISQTSTEIFNFTSISNFLRCVGYKIKFDLIFCGCIWLLFQCNINDTRKSCYFFVGYIFLKIQSTRADNAKSLAISRLSNHFFETTNLIFICQQLKCYKQRVWSSARELFSSYV